MARTVKELAALTVTDKGRNLSDGGSLKGKVDEHTKFLTGSLMSPKWHANRTRVGFTQSGDLGYTVSPSQHHYMDFNETNF